MEAIENQGLPLKMVNQSAKVKTSMFVILASFEQSTHFNQTRVPATLNNSLQT
jgi:hypothetical protein